jgi:hypothetical protein
MLARNRPVRSDNDDYHYFDGSVLFPTVCGQGHTGTHSPLKASPVLEESQYILDAEKQVAQRDGNHGDELERPEGFWKVSSKRQRSFFAYGVTHGESPRWIYCKDNCSFAS